jgi:hypothetical protein
MSSHPRLVAHVLADTAWERYAALRADLSRLEPGEQLDFLQHGPVFAAAREWLGIALACEAYAHG